VFGFSRYWSVVDVWLEKTGRTVHESDGLLISFGPFAEDFEASEYGITLRLNPQFESTMLDNTFPTLTFTYNHYTFQIISD